MKKSWSTRYHFTYAQSCSYVLNQVLTRAKQPASIRTYSLWKGDIFWFDRFTGYTKSNQNRFGRVLLFAFALTCYKISLFFPSLSDFDSFSWRVHLSYGVCRLCMRVPLKTLLSLLKEATSALAGFHAGPLPWLNLWREENQRTQGKSLRARHTWLHARINWGPHWWEASTLTTVYMRYWTSVNSRWLDIDQVLFFVDRDGVIVH